MLRGQDPLIPNPPSQQLRQAGSPGAHSCVSPSPATGKMYWFELLLMGIKSELILLAWCSEPSPYTQVGVAPNTFPLNKHLPKLPPWDPDLGRGRHRWAEITLVRSAPPVICMRGKTTTVQSTAYLYLQLSHSLYLTHGPYLLL